MPNVGKLAAGSVCDTETVGNSVTHLSGAIELTFCEHFHQICESVPSVCGETKSSESWSKDCRNRFTVKSLNVLGNWYKEACNGWVVDQAEAKVTQGVADVVVGIRSGVDADQVVDVDVLSKLDVFSDYEVRRILSKSGFSGHSEGGPVGHVVELESVHPLLPVGANLILPELSVLGPKTENAGIVVVALRIPVALSHSNGGVEGRDTANWELESFVFGENSGETHLAGNLIATRCEAARRCRRVGTRIAVALGRESSISEDWCVSAASLNSS